MRISGIHIDGFGTWKDLFLGDLSPGVTVIYGPNEAGKTTLMQFVRTVLYGFSPARRTRYLPPVHGGRPGGSLAIGSGVANEGNGVFQVVRHASIDDPTGFQGDVSVVNPDGTLNGHGQLESLLSGVDESTFTNVFAIGLREIQELGSLDDTAAADHLYRLTGGLDRVSLVDVVRELHSSRQHIVGNGEKPGAVAALVMRRDKLRDELRELLGRTDRWLKLATLRSELVEEAKNLDEDIANLEERVRVIDVALQARELWQSRCDVRKRLEKIGTPKEIRKKYLLLLKKFNDRIAVSLTRNGEIKTERTKLVEAVKAIKINHAVWSQAARIEALTEHSGWVQTLEAQIERLKKELQSYEGNLQSQTVSAGTPGFDVGLANQQTIQALRRPARAISEEEERFETAKRNAEEARQEFETLVARVDQRLIERNETDLQTALANAAERIQLFRRRLQIDQRLEQLNRHREELEGYRDDLFERHVMPVWITVGLGVAFATGIMMVLLGIWSLIGNWDSSIQPFPLILIGAIVAALAAGAKVGMERQTSMKLDAVRKQLAMVSRQGGEVRVQRDDLDSQLPAGGGAIDIRMQRAEEDLRRLEELLPLQTQREVLKAKLDAAKRLEVDAEAAVKEARSRYKSILRSLGLPETFSISSLRQHSQKGEELTHTRRQVEVVRDELQQRERELLSLATRIDQLMGDIRVKPVSDRPQDRLAQLNKVVEEQRDFNLLKGDLRRKVRELRKEFEKSQRVMKRDERSRESIFNKLGVRHEKDFHRAVERWRQFRILGKRQATLSEKILVVLADRITQDQLEAELIENADGVIEVRRESALGKVRDYRVRLGQLHERRGQAQQEMTMLADDRRLDEVKVEVGAVERQIAAQMRRWQILAATEHTLTSVRKIYETHRQPETLREASEYLQRLTSGHYTRIWTPLEDRALRVDDANGKPVRLDVLSRGTREAIFLSLRLALVNSFAKRGAKLPLVLDDVLVNFDTGRVKAAAALLRDFAEQHKQQILMFTCHEHVMHIFRGVKVDVRTLPGHDVPREEVAKPNRKKAEVKEESPPLLLPAPATVPAENTPAATAPVVTTPAVTTPPPVHATLEAVENVPDFHEFAYKVGEDTRGLRELWSAHFNDEFGTEEVVVEPPVRRKPASPQPTPPPNFIKNGAANSVRHELAPAKRKPPMTDSAPRKIVRQRFAWESPERYVEDDLEEQDRQSSFID